MPTRHRYDGFNDALSTTHFSERHLRHGPTGQGLDFGFQGLMFRFGDLLRYVFPSRKDSMPMRLFLAQKSLDFGSFEW